MGLTEKQKKIAWDAWLNTEVVQYAIFAAVEAVLAEQPRAAEQEDALANTRWELSKVRPGCVDCGAPITVSDPTSTTCHAHAAEQPAQGQDSVALIAAERERQIKGEGWTLDHDDAHKHGELAAAASCYAHHANCQARKFQPSYVAGRPSDWPWDAKWWKPSVYPVRNLVKAGALIAAEIDRLARLAKPAEQTDEQKVEAILTKHFHHIGVVDAAAEIVATLRRGLGS